MKIDKKTELNRDVYVAHAEIAGQEITVTTGKVAQQAGGSVMVQVGGTVVLATAVVADKERPDIDFFPLVVDYFDKMYAAGKIPGGFFKRGGRPSDQEILRSRLIDRPLRPLFPKHFRRDVQIVVSTLSSDGENIPDFLGIIGASCALTISDAPFEGPLAAVRIGLIDGELVVNPTVTMLQKSTLDLVVAGTNDAIMMVEGGATQVDEETIAKAMELAQASFADIISVQNELQKQIGKQKIVVPPPEIDPEVLQLVHEELFRKGDEKLFNPDKTQRESASGEFEQEIKALVQEKLPEKTSNFGLIFEKELKSFVRDRIVIQGKRPDGRKTNEIRPISMEVGTLPMTHGSAIFLRGQTQVLSVTTLGAKDEGQLVEGLYEEEIKHYMHYYNFPPFSVGEVRPLRGPSRRDIGHGNLAERSLVPLIPTEEEFPYTIQVFSEVLESNGSSSMASVCCSSLSLMDAGVPLKAPVAGIAMGLITSNDKIAILTDIQGVEDALGDMDFKVAGTVEGITGLQMDIKIKGIDMNIIRRALAQAREARMFILGLMKQCLPEPRAELSPNAPRVYTMTIDTEKIREVIGPGGKVIKKIIEDTGCKIDIEQDGRVFITAPNEEAGMMAKGIISEITEDVTVGKIYLGRVTGIRDFGAFVDIGKGGKEGLLHISEIANHRVAKVEDELKVGQEVMVKVKKIDETGRISLTRKGLLETDSGTIPPSIDSDEGHGDDHHGKRHGKDRRR
ncbi:MAG: polyribonucleotide nucleotidyltransferase [Caldisericales bacterium]|nr:polyribonucleotide nucleotidyltransferase [Caldisericales bacterium]